MKQPEAQYDTEWEQRWPNAVTPQPKALRLADVLEQQFPIGTAQHYLDGEAAAELRRLHEANQAMLEALTAIVNSAAANQAAILSPLIDDARAAIAKGEAK